MPWERAVAIIRDRPKAASQDDIVSMIRGVIKGLANIWWGQRLRPIKMVSIIPSRHKRADKRCMRWKDRPARTMENITTRRMVTGALWI